MIIDADKSGEAGKSITSPLAPGPVAAPTPNNLDEPPPYSPTTLPQLPGGIKPVNHLSVTRTADAALRDNFLLDPALAIPNTLLPPWRGQSNKRPNLFLETKSGLLDADVWIVPGAAAALRGREITERSNKPAHIEIKSDKGPVCVRLNVHESTTSPIHLTALSTSSSVTVFLPRSFRGTLSTKGRTTFSDALNPEVVVLEDADGAQRAWIGDFDPPSDTQQEPSSLHISASEGHVLLAYTDEETAFAQALPATDSALIVDPREPAEDPDTRACPKGLVSWIIQSIERRLVCPDVKIEMSVLTGTNVRTSHPL